jgi:hypothetical protein
VQQHDRFTVIEPRYPEFREDDRIQKVDGEPLSAIVDGRVDWGEDVLAEIEQLDCLRILVSEWIQEVQIKLNDLTEQTKAQIVKPLRRHVDVLLWDERLLRGRRHGCL